MIPNLSDVLTELLTSYGLTLRRNYDATSSRPEKRYIGMLAWKSPETGDEVFVYEDNTIGLRSEESTVVEVDLNMVEPNSCAQLEAWLKRNRDDA